MVVKRWAADDTVDWPEEAVRRYCLGHLEESGFYEHPAIRAMSDRLACWLTAKLCQDAEEQGVVAWEGDAADTVAEGSVRDQWPHEWADPRVLAGLAAPSLRALQVTVLDLEIDLVEWWSDARAQYATG